ncbi:MAG: Asp-tRNA(Asn)/Glu-tRNA(Gln) amidotransferase subunit GatA [Deltaproteobacteria bacterium]|jgi:aspartyl-tRNA(Asn)/glutamyl-tRNA(Gln) amidotransferase subunit A|nr:Asp-tRNA(Asn)/Glu-tRNA(Gln) amidotransferase subunit GatA [Deltaproteobacteria bacterium]
MASDPNLTSLTLAEAREGLLKRDFSSAELVRATLDRIDETEPRVQACLHVLRDKALADAAALDGAGPDRSKPLWGLPVTVKDVFLVRGAPTTAGSRMLSGYMPGFEAGVVTRLRAAGAVITAKTNLDEFAMGSSTEFSAFRPTRNPWNLSRVPGGSSGGAAAGISARQAPGAFGTDTGGSIRQPAALCGCVGLKPTYGRVSRYGIVAYGSSLDQAGPLARTVGDCGMLFGAVAGPDGRDSTSSRVPLEDLSAMTPPEASKLRFALPRELWEGRFDTEVEKVLSSARRVMESAGIRLEAVSMPSIRYSVAAYYVIAAAEASTNLARYDGVRYGLRAPGRGDLLSLYRESRTEGLGPEARRRILLGTFALSSGYYDAYYRKAAQVRRLIHEEYARILGEFDFILAPVSSIPAWPFGSFTDDPLTQYQLDVMTLPLNLAGGPGLSLPAGLGADGLPVGIQIQGPHFREKPLLEAGMLLESMFPRLPEPAFVSG